MAVNVYFSTKIRSDGEIIRVTLKQGDSAILLTREQAAALGQQLTDKFKITSAPPSA